MNSDSCAHCGHGNDIHQGHGGYAICEGNDGQCDCDGTDGPLDGDPPVIPAPPRGESELARSVDELDAVQSARAFGAGSQTQKPS